MDQQTWQSDVPKLPERLGATREFISVQAFGKELTRFSEFERPLAERFAEDLRPWADGTCRLVKVVEEMIYIGQKGDANVHTETTNEGA